MKVYLVGGALRDMALGRPVRERDWVVVGATPEQLESLGFKRVGRSFPVFLHPKTHEEYALARTELQSGPKHTDFKVLFSPQTTLEEDLKRRDLTINALAQAPGEEVIDLYGGLSDLRSKLFRHLSEAFKEDALRVLRVARFAATEWGASFEVAEETEHLVLKMVGDKQLDALSESRIWRETLKALESDRPDRYFALLARWGVWSSWGLKPSDLEGALQRYREALRWPFHDPIIRYALWLDALSPLAEATEADEVHLEAWNERLGAPLEFSAWARWSRSLKRFSEDWLKLPLTAVDWYKLVEERSGRWPSALESKLDWALLQRCRYREAEAGVDLAAWPRLKGRWMHWIEEAHRLKLTPEELSTVEASQRSDHLRAKRLAFLEEQSQAQRR